MSAPVIDLSKYRPVAIPGMPSVPTPVATPAPAAPSPLATLDLNNVGGVHLPAGIVNKNVLPPELGGPASNSPIIPTPITPIAMPQAAAPKTVGSSTTAPATPAPAIPTSSSSTAQNGLGATLAAFGASLQGLSDSLKTNASGTDANGNPTGTPAGGDTTGSGGTLADTLKQILTLNTKLGTKGDATNAANEEQDVAGKMQKVQDLTNQYNARSRYYDDKIKAVQSTNVEGKSATAIQEEVDQLTREKNSELADIAIQQSAASGNLTVAQNIATQKVNAEFEPVQDQIDNLKTYYSLASNDLTDSEKLQAQAAIAEKQDALDESKQKRLALYTEQIKQSDPLYQAQVAHEQALAANPGSSGGTVAERQANAISTLQTSLDSNTPLKSGDLPIDANGFLTPEAWKSLIAQAPSEGLDRSSFIKAFGNYIYSDPKTGIPSSYGITPAEQKLITGALPDSGS